MKRPAQMRKKDKQKGKTNVKEAPMPEQEEEVVNTTQVNRPLWTDMLSHADEIVGDIMDELQGQVMDGCYKSYIEKQLVPYSVSWVKNYLTKTVECQVLCLDQGEEPEELASTEDLEPVTAIPDCWAQGCVPTINVVSQSHCTSQQEVASDQESSESSLRRRSRRSSLKIWGLKHDEIEEKHKKDESDLSSTVSSTCPPARSDRKKIRQTKKPPKDTRSKVLESLPPLPPLSEKKHVEVEVEVEGGDKDSVARKTPLAYRHKDLHPIPKLDLKRLPQHCISPEYEIVDNDFARHSPRKPCVLPRLEPTLTKQKSKRAEILSKTISKEPPERFQKKSDDNIHLHKQDKERHALFGPLRLDTMILAKGVSLLDSQAAKSIPPKMSYPSQATNLKPIPSDVAVPIYSVDLVAAASTPRVTPIMQTKNDDS